MIPVRKNICQDLRFPLLVGRFNFLPHNEGSNHLMAPLLEYRTSHVVVEIPLLTSKFPVQRMHFQHFNSPSVKGSLQAVFDVASGKL